MKKIILSLAILLCMVKSSSQAQMISRHSKFYYLNKSELQKKQGRIILGIGLGLVGTGALLEFMSANDKAGLGGTEYAGAFIALIGTSFCISSITLFISSSIIKKRAASIVINNQRIMLPQENSFVSKTQPALTLRIKL